MGTRHLWRETEHAEGSKLLDKLGGGGGTTDEKEAWLTLVERNVPDPEIADLIYHSKEGLTACYFR